MYKLLKVSKLIFKVCLYSQVIQFCSQNIYRLFKKISLAPMLSTPNIGRLSTEYALLYNNNNIN